MNSRVSDGNGHNRNAMRTIEAFYYLHAKNGKVPPTAEQLAGYCKISPFTVYRHLNKGVDYGYIRYELVHAKRVGGDKGLRAYHPVALITKEKVT